jgi:hypothetical protein
MRVPLHSLPAELVDRPLCVSGSSSSRRGPATRGSGPSRSVALSRVSGPAYAAGS